jgi:anti-anti-sigma factor
MNMLRLSGECTIAQAAELREQLLAQLAESDGSSAPVLDLSGVTGFDSAGVQLLLALRRSLLDAGRVLSLQAPSAAVRETLATYHLSPEDLGAEREADER